MADILLGNVKGPQGIQGEPGETGERGSAATINVGTVSTTAYGNTAQVINSGTEQDAVLDFVIPQGKPGEQTTRMGALTLDTITAQSADFPIPAVGETGSTVFGKIIKFFNSTISALNSKLNISDVVNNLTSTSATQPLSAAQGKALNDAFSTFSNSGFSGDLGTMYVYKYHKVLMFQWAGNGTALPSAQFTFTTVLPVGYRPLYNVTTTVRTSDNMLGYLQISTTGQITINTPSSANRTWTSANAVGLSAN